VNQEIGDSTITNSPIPAFANYCLMVLYVGNFGRTSFFGGFFPAPSESPERRVRGGALATDIIEFLSR
jgi:hypothetical protein